MSIKGIKLLVFDVDGVLTDGKLYFGPSGEELKTFDARDGAGIKCLMESGVECAILSARDSAALRHRAESLGIRHAITGAGDKAPELRRLIESLGLKRDEIGYVGDDLMDLPPMRLAGWSACPADAAPEVREAADYVAASPGGSGVAREVAELLLKAEGKWEAVLARYRGE